MSWISEYLRRRKISPEHQTRRALSRYVEKEGFEIGDYTYGSPEILTGGDARLSIGSYCSIASGVKIFLGVGNHRKEWVSTYPFRATAAFPEAHGLKHSPEVGRGDVKIGSDVWIGANAIVLSGITIGHGAIVGAGAVVSRDVPAYAVVVGNPAREVSTRFPETVIPDLLETRWWTLPREQIVALLPLLNSANVEEFLAECRKLRRVT